MQRLDENGAKFLTWQVHPSQQDTFPRASSREQLFEERTIVPSRSAGSTEHQLRGLLFKIKGFGRSSWRNNACICRFSSRVRIRILLT